MTKKIILINNAYPSPQMPNSGTYAESIKLALESGGFHVDTIVLRPSGSGLKKIKDYITFYSRLLLAPLKQYDVLYINHYTFLLPLFIRIPLQKNKIIYHWHGEELIHNTWLFKFIRSLMKKTFKSTDIHISPSHYYGSIIAKQLKIDPKKILISPSGGVDTDLFSPIYHKQKGEVLHIGFPSSLTEHKGVDYLLKLIQDIPKLQLQLKKEIYIHYINYGDKENKWKKLFYKNPVNLVEYEPYKKNEMYKFYRNIDICLMFSKRESLGLVVLEAMACNVPVIARNTTSMTELILPGINGELIPFLPNIKEIEDKIIMIYQHINQYTPAKFVCENYSKNIVSSFYKRLLTNKEII